MRALPVVAALLLGTAAPAQTRLSLSPSLSVAAGWDDNLFLDPSLAGAAPPRADAVFDIRPSLGAALVRRGHRLAFDADYLERITPSNGDLRDLALGLGWQSPVRHRLRLGLGALFDHYEATRFADNTFDLGGGDASLRVVLTPAWLQAAYRFDARGYTDPTRNAQLDLEQQVGISAGLEPHRTLALDLGYQFLAVASNEPTAALARHRGVVDVSWQPAAWFSAAASYALWYQALPHGAPPLSPVQPGGARRDLAHAVSAAVSFQPRAWLRLFVRYQLISSTSDEPNGRYRLDEVVAGIALASTFAHEHVPPPPPLVPAVRGRDVTFRARARPGARVAVVGDWTGWQPQPLRPAGGDRYEATYTLPPGRHAWALSVDGVVTTPPEATGFVDDGFGGKNAVVDVPEGASAAPPARTMSR